VNARCGRQPAALLPPPGSSPGRALPVTVIARYRRRRSRPSPSDRAGAGGLREDDDRELSEVTTLCPRPGRPRPCLGSTPRSTLAVLEVKDQLGSPSRRDSRRCPRSPLGVGGGSEEGPRRRVTRYFRPSAVRSATPFVKSAARLSTSSRAGRRPSGERRVPRDGDVVGGGVEAVTVLLLTSLGSACSCR